MSKATKQATKALEVAADAGISYSTHRYEHDPSHESFGLEAAEKMDTDPARVFKTLIVSVDGTLAVGIVPVTQQLDLKAIAQTLGSKSATMADVPLAEKTTGYITGAISPLGQKRQLQTVLDESAELFPTICVSAGRRGLEIELSATDLLSLTGGVAANIAR